MYRSEENRVKTIGASFYENVFLLTQVVSPSFEFQRHFKKDMFAKPNTAGFLHVSHYLSNIYDMKLFKQMVSWPILCKKDEITYRNEMKNFLFILFQDNPDANIPPILTSYLIQAGGIKFLIIMWKMSQLALRTYIKKQFQKELSSIPCTSQVNDLTIMYFNRAIAENCNTAKEMHREAKRILDTASNFLKDKIELPNMYELQIFNRKENIKKLVLQVSTYPFIQKRLMDIEDSALINTWKRNLWVELQYMHIKNKELKKLEESLECLCKFIQRTKSNTKVLDASEFSRITSNNCLLHVQSEIQHLFHVQRADGLIAFSALLSLLRLASERMLHCISISDSQNWLQCLQFIQNACENMESLRASFITLDTLITGLLRNEQHVSRKIEDIHETDSIYNVNRNIFLHSPNIKFNFNKYMDNNLFYETLYLSPVEGKHKHLFKRYKRKYYQSSEIFVTSLELSHSLQSSMSRWLSPRIYSSKCEQVTFGKPISPLYSRVLHISKLRPICLNLSETSRENTPHSPNHEELRSNKCRSISGYSLV